jgi:hypothetical protein
MMTKNVPRPWNLLRYDRGEEVRISLSLDDETTISKLGFDPKAA